jgi:hypothetical protein
MGTETATMADHPMWGGSSGGAWPLPKRRGPEADLAATPGL